MNDDLPGASPVQRMVRPVAEAHGWLAAGMTWALINAHDPATEDGWSAGDLARAFAAGAAAAVAAERERQHAKAAAHLARSTMSVYGTQAECRAARDALQRLMDDGA